MMIARPMATSPAATPMMKVAKVCPIRSGVFASLENATKFRFAALRISSIDMKMMMALRLVRTPRTPMANRIADRPRRWFAVIIAPSQPEPGEHDGPDHRDEEQHRHELEGK